MPGEERPGVTVVVPRLDVGGAERHLLLVLPRLRAAGVDVDLFVIHPGGKLDGDMRAAGIPLSGPSAAITARWAQLLVSGLLLFAAMLRRRRRLFHFFLPEAYLVGGLAGALTRHGGLVMSRRSLNRYQAAHPVAARLERFLHRRMAAVLANSQAVRADLLAEGVAEAKLALIRNGMDFTPFARPVDRVAGRADLGIGPQTLVLCIVANLIPYKGHGDLLRAVAAWRGGGRDWALLCVGRKDRAAADLARLCAELELGGHVHFLGQRGDVPALLTISDIGLLCSHEEGFSNSILEGMAAGLPMIVSDAGGNGEAIAHGRTGLVYPAGDVAALTAALEQLAARPEARRDLGAAGRDWVMRHCSLEACVAAYCGLYKSLSRRA